MAGVQLNKVFVAGNLTKDPDVRITSTGKSVANFTIAANHGEKTNFVPVVVFGKGAELVEQYLSKGKPVLITGHLQTSRYEKNGETRFSMNVVSENIQFLPSPRRSVDADYDVEHMKKKADGYMPDADNDYDVEIPF